MIRVFLDSSVIIAGINSNTGASQVILALSQKKKIAIYVSQIVINEAIRNIKKKLPENILLKFYKYLAVSNFEKIDFQKEEEVTKYANITVEKDIHVIAGAYKTKAKYLITLDKKHLLKINNRDLPFQIVSPKIFLDLTYRLRP